jgi:ribosomal protein S18 acetylase RimI-like enzyme
MTNARMMPPTHFTIRMARPDDAAAIDWLDSFGASPQRDVHRLIVQYFGSVDPTFHERTVIYLAELAHRAPADLPFRAIGKVELLLAPAKEQSDIGYIKRVVVHPAWRGQGIARAILAHVREDAAVQGLRHLDLHVAEDNASAIALYDSLGFTERHREIYMRLTLDPPEAAEDASEPDVQADAAADGKTGTKG